MNPSSQTFKLNFLDHFPLKVFANYSGKPKQTARCTRPHQPYRITKRGTSIRSYDSPLILNEELHFTGE